MRLTYLSIKTGVKEVIKWHLLLLLKSKYNGVLVQARGRKRNARREQVRRNEAKEFNVFGLEGKEQNLFWKFS